MAVTRQIGDMYGGAEGDSFVSVFEHLPLFLRVRGNLQVDNFRALLARANDGRIKRMLPPSHNVNSVLFGFVRQIFNPLCFVLPETSE